MSEQEVSVTGPIPGTPFIGTPEEYDLGALGYLNDEYLVEGTAKSYTAEPAQAPYCTRLVVRRPLQQEWNGKVLVEWFNVSGGLDAAPDWAFTHRHLIRESYAWVGVSVQRAGIEGGGLTDGMTFPLKRVDSERYASLQHPGDAFSFDIFSHVGRAVRDGRLFGGRKPRCVLAIGESQSAAFLVTYVNEVDAEARVYDGYLIHGRAGRVAALDGTRRPTRSLEAAAADVSSGEASDAQDGAIRFRRDLRVPVLVLQSETDVLGLGSVRARQPDTDRLRLWEVAGAAHADTYMLIASAYDDGSLSPEALANYMAATKDVHGMTMAMPINAGPQQHYVLQAALAHLDRWVAKGTLPPSAPRLELAAENGPLLLDELGIAQGGLRTPWVDVPTAVFSGFGQQGAGFAFLFGTTRPFDKATLKRLYPGGHSDFLTRFAKATRETVARGFLLAADAEEIQQVAAATPWLGS